MTAPNNLSTYATQFDELETASRTPVIDLNAINPLSKLRETWQNTSDTNSEHHLSTTADTDDTAWLETDEHGQYSAGYMVESGVGIRIPSLPTGDSVMRWGYYDVDTNGDPVNGFYFGADADGVFVAYARSGNVTRIYQDDWNRDKLGDYSLNPSDRTLDLSDGIVCQIDFSYYGYGPIEFKFLADDDDDDQYGSADLVTAHVLTVPNSTSTENTNLPLRQEIVSGGTSNDALDLFVGGRQFTVVGKRSSNRRTTGHYLNEVTGIDDTKWYHAISFKIKDGTDIGSIDFSHVLAQVGGFDVDTDQNAYRWQIRRGTTPDNPVWENPTSAEDNQDETALKVDTNSADIQDGSGNLTGVMLDGGNLAEGGNNSEEVRDIDATGEIVGEQIVSLVFKAVPGATGTVSNIYLRALERW